MTLTLRKWGNSIGLRLPKNLLKESNLEVGVQVIVEINKDALLIKKSEKESLEQICSKITSDNSHQETDWGKIEGNEVW